jgi:hypothetical protein
VAWYEQVKRAWEEREEDGTVDDKAKHRTGGHVPSLSSHCLGVFELFHRR